MAVTMWPDSRASAPNTAIVITASTTPYSAMVWPASLSLRFRRSSRSKNFSIGFTSLRGVRARQTARLRWTWDERARSVLVDSMEFGRTVNVVTGSLLGAVDLGVAAPPRSLVDPDIAVSITTGHPSRG